MVAANRPAKLFAKYDQIVVAGETNDLLESGNVVFQSQSDNWVIHHHSLH